MKVRLTNLYLNKFLFIYINTLVHEHLLNIQMNMDKITQYIPDIVWIVLCAYTNVYRYVLELWIG